MSVNGGFQYGPFQVNFQQVVPTPALPGQFPIANYVGLDWYVASYNIFLAGLVQQDPPVLVQPGPFFITTPGQVIAQVPPVGTLVFPGSVVHLTVVSELLLSVTFNVLN